MMEDAHIAGDAAGYAADDTRVTIDDVRAVGLCVAGSRAWFSRHGLDFRAFLAGGLPAADILATGDAMALRAVQQARLRTARQREEGV
ncbi:MAG: hypothetical protein AB1412_09325 [Pseudomonadota bacterium]